MTPETPTLVAKIRPAETYDPQTRTVSRWEGSPLGAGVDNLMAKGVVLSFYQFTWNRGHDRTARILLLEDGRLFVRRGRERAIDPTRPGRPSCRVDPRTVAAVRGAIKDQRLSELAPYMYMGGRRPECSPGCREATCARGSCYELHKTSTGRTLELRARWSGSARIVRARNVKDDRIRQRITAALAPLRACRAVLSRTFRGGVALWEESVD